MIGTNKIGVVILNYNDAETTLHLCDLIRGYSAIDHIAVVDNLSPDGSYETLKHTGGGENRCHPDRPKWGLFLWE